MEKNPTHTHTHTLCCTSETNTTLQINYTRIKKLTFRKKNNKILNPRQQIYSKL